jgi:hypothetical protein
VKWAVIGYVKWAVISYVICACIAYLQYTHVSQLFTPAVSECSQAELGSGGMRMCGGFTVCMLLILQD